MIFRLAMKTNLLITAALSLSLNSFASGPLNVGGIAQRLESLSCLSGGLVKLKNFENLAKKCEQEADANSCLKAVFTKNNVFHENLRFEGVAIKDSKDFVLKAFLGNKKIFESVRNATHGDGQYNGNPGFMLMFYRKGTDGNDQFMVESGAVSGNEADGLFVPIKKRFGADELAVFTGKCRLVWDNTVNEG